MAVLGVKLTTGEDLVYQEVLTMHDNDYIEMENPVRVVVQRNESGDPMVAFVPYNPLYNGTKFKVYKSQLINVPQSIDSELEKEYSKQFNLVWSPPTRIVM